MELSWMILIDIVEVVESKQNEHPWKADGFNVSTQFEKWPSGHGLVIIDTSS